VDGVVGDRVTGDTVVGPLLGDLVGALVGDLLASRRRPETGDAVVGDAVVGDAVIAGHEQAVHTFVVPEQVLAY
jgi:hypothetical protein